jgi:hypothetical protein
MIQLIFPLGTSFVQEVAMWGRVRERQVMKTRLEEEKKSGIGELEILRFGTEVSSMDNEGEKTESGNDNRVTTKFTNMPKY